MRAARIQFRPHLHMVVNLAIKRNDETPTARGHRLVPRTRQVNNGEATKPRRDALLRIRPGTRVIRAAMLDSHGHLGGNGL